MQAGVAVDIFQFERKLKKFFVARVVLVLNELPVVGMAFVRRRKRVFEFGFRIVGNAFFEHIDFA